MSQNQFAGGPQVNEKFSEIYDNNTESLNDLNGNEIVLEGGGLYGNFKNPEEENLKQEEQISKLSEKISNSPDFPVIERLKDSGKISKEEYDSFLSDIDSNNGELSEDYKNNVSEYLGEDLGPEEKLDIFKKDLKKSQVLSEFFEGVDKKPVDSIDFQLYKIVGENYSKFDIGEGNFDLEKDISTAINISANKIINLHKTLNKDSQTFKNSMNDIRGGGLKEQLSGLKNLCLLSFSSAGSISKKSERQKKDILDKSKSRKEYLEEKIENLRKNILLEKNLEIKKKYETEIINYTKEIDEIKSGEVFNSSEIDSSNESLEKTDEEPKPINPKPSNVKTMIA